MAHASFDTIVLARDGDLAILTLNRPESLNALSHAMLGEIIAALDVLRDEGGARALLLRGAGRAFCAGADLSPGHASDPHDLGRSLELLYNPAIERLAALPFPVVAAVQGPAAGAGCALALAADIVIAGRSAYFLQAFVNIGLVPDAGTTWVLPRLIGRARALGMMMLGERVSAEQAAAWGMIYEQVEDDALSARALAVAQRLAQGPTRTHALIRQGVRASLEQSLTETLAAERRAQRQAGRSRDFAEGVQAFREKRAAVFEGK